MKCCECDSDYEENYYKYEKEIYCFDCLTEKLEDEGNLNMATVTHYYSDEWTELGTSDDINQTIQNICENYVVEEIENDFKEG